MRNCAKVSFAASSVNEGFARMVVMGFMMDMNPTMDELTDVKTAVSEAVTNAIIHGYEEDASKQVEMTCLREDEKLIIIVEDYGIGIADIDDARQPFFTTKSDMERSGMGFVFMETFMDEIQIESQPGKGTRIEMIKYIKQDEATKEEGEQ